jgi:hypothetical protein
MCMMHKLKEPLLRICGWLLLFNMIYQIYIKFVK